MKSTIQYFRIIIAITAITICTSFFGCNGKQNSTNDKPSIDTVKEYIKVYVNKDTSDYSTSVIESNNPEAPDVLIVQFRVKFMNITEVPFPKKPVVLEQCEIIENPYEEAAQFSLDYKGNPNGFYFEDGKKMNLPLNLYPYQSVSCILKHGQTIDSKTLGFLKSRFKDLKSLKSKEVFQALLENGLNLCNDKAKTEQIFQLNFFSGNHNSFTRDVVFPYTNYCK